MDLASKSACKASKGANGRLESTLVRIKVIPFFATKKANVFSNFIAQMRGIPQHVLRLSMPKRPTCDYLEGALWNRPIAAMVSLWLLLLVFALTSRAHPCPSPRVATITAPRCVEPRRHDVLQQAVRRSAGGPSSTASREGRTRRRRSLYDSMGNVVLFAAAGPRVVSSLLNCSELSQSSHDGPLIIPVSSAQTNNNFELENCYVSRPRAKPRSVTFRLAATDTGNFVSFSLTLTRTQISGVTFAVMAPENIAIGLTGFMSIVDDSVIDCTNGESVAFGDPKSSSVSVMPCFAFAVSAVTNFSVLVEHSIVKMLGHVSNRSWHRVAVLSFEWHNATAVTLMQTEGPPDDGGRRRIFQNVSIDIRGSSQLLATSMWEPARVLSFSDALPGLPSRPWLVDGLRLTIADSVLAAWSAATVPTMLPDATNPSPPVTSYATVIHIDGTLANSILSLTDVKFGRTGWLMTSRDMILRTTFSFTHVSLHPVDSVITDNMESDEGIGTTGFFSTSNSTAVTFVFNHCSFTSLAYVFNFSTAVSNTTFDIRGSTFSTAESDTAPFHASAFAFVTSGRSSSSAVVGIRDVSISLLEDSLVLSSEVFLLRCILRNVTVAIVNSSVSAITTSAGRTAVAFELQGAVEANRIAAGRGPASLPPQRLGITLEGANVTLASGGDTQLFHILSTMASAGATPPPGATTIPFDAFRIHGIHTIITCSSSASGGASLWVLCLDTALARAAVTFVSTRLLLAASTASNSTTAGQLAENAYVLAATSIEATWTDVSFDFDRNSELAVSVLGFAGVISTAASIFSSTISMSASACRIAASTAQFGLLQGTNLSAVRVLWTGMTIDIATVLTTKMFYTQLLTPFGTSSRAVTFAVNDSQVNVNATWFDAFYVQRDQNGTAMVLHNCTLAVYAEYGVSLWTISIVGGKRGFGIIVSLMRVRLTISARTVRYFPVKALVFMSALPYVPPQDEVGIATRGVDRYAVTVLVYDCDFRVVPRATMAVTSAAGGLTLLGDAAWFVTDAHICIERTSFDLRMNSGVKLLTWVGSATRANVSFSSVTVNITAITITWLGTGTLESSAIAFTGVLASLQTLLPAGSAQDVLSIPSMVDVNVTVLNTSIRMTGAATTAFAAGSSSRFLRLRWLSERVILHAVGNSQSGGELNVFRTTSPVSLNTSTIQFVDCDTFLHSESVRFLTFAGANGSEITFIRSVVRAVAQTSAEVLELKPHGFAATEVNVFESHLNVSASVTPSTANADDGFKLISTQQPQTASRFHVVRSNMTLWNNQLLSRMPLGIATLNSNSTIEVCQSNFTRSGFNGTRYLITVQSCPANTYPPVSTTSVSCDGSLACWSPSNRTDRNRIVDVTATVLTSSETSVSISNTSSAISTSNTTAEATSPTSSVITALTTTTTPTSLSTATPTASPTTITPSTATETVISNSTASFLTGLTPSSDGPITTTASPTSPGDAMPPPPPSPTPSMSALDSSGPRLPQTAVDVQGTATTSVLVASASTMVMAPPGGVTAVQRAMAVTNVLSCGTALLDAPSALQAPIFTFALWHGDGDNYLASSVNGSRSGPPAELTAGLPGNQQYLAVMHTLAAVENALILFPVATATLAIFFTMWFLVRGPREGCSRDERDEEEGTDNNAASPLQRPRSMTAMIITQLPRESRASRWLFITRMPSCVILPAAVFLPRALESAVLAVSAAHQAAGPEPNGAAVTSAWLCATGVCAACGLCVAAPAFLTHGPRFGAIMIREDDEHDDDDELRQETDDRRGELPVGNDRVKRGHVHDGRRRSTSCACAWGRRLLTGGVAWVPRVIPTVGNNQVDVPKHQQPSQQPQYRVSLYHYRFQALYDEFVDARRWYLSVDLFFMFAMTAVGSARSRSEQVCFTLPILILVLATLSLIALVGLRPQASTIIFSQNVVVAMLTVLASILTLIPNTRAVAPLIGIAATVLGVIRILGELLATTFQACVATTSQRWKRLKYFRDIRGGGNRIVFGSNPAQPSPCASRLDVPLLADAPTEGSLLPCPQLAPAPVQVYDREGGGGRGRTKSATPASPTRPGSSTIDDILAMLDEESQAPLGVATLRPTANHDDAEDGGLSRLLMNPLEWSAAAVDSDPSSSSSLSHGLNGGSVTVPSSATRDPLRRRIAAANRTDIYSTTVRRLDEDDEAPLGDGGGVPFDDFFSGL